MNTFILLTRTYGILKHKLQNLMYRLPVHIVKEKYYTILLHVFVNKLLTSFKLNNKL